MSTNGDSNNSGTPDVASEQQHSLPSTGRSRGGRHQSTRPSRNDTMNSSLSSNRGRGKNIGRGGRMRPGQKENSGDQPITLMRTHSAPPDEHAGIFELGGNGVRANSMSQQYFGKQVYQEPLDFTTKNPVEITPPGGRPHGNVSFVTPIEEKVTEEKIPDPNPSTEGRPSVTLAQPVQLPQQPPPIPFYTTMDLPRGFPQTQQIQQPLAPTFQNQPRLIGHRQLEVTDPRNKLTPMVPIQLAPRMPPPQLMPQYQFAIQPPLQMMPNQARPLATVPLQSPQMFPPQIMYPIYPPNFQQAAFTLPNGVPINRNHGMMASPMDVGPRPVLLDSRMQNMGGQKIPPAPGLYSFPPSPSIYPLQSDPQFHSQPRMQNPPTEGAKKRNLVLKDKSGKVIVPKDLLSESNENPSNLARAVEEIIDSTQDESSKVEPHVEPSHEDNHLSPQVSSCEDSSSESKDLPHVEPFQSESNIQLSEDQISAHPDSTKMETVPQTQPNESIPLSDKRTKKNFKKDKISAADLAVDNPDKDLLDAYKIANPVSDEKTSEAPVDSPVMPEEDPDEDWETQASKLPEEQPAKPVMRSLRPGGGAPIQKRINAGPSSLPQPLLFVYSKSEILALRLGVDPLERPTQCLSYEKILYFGPDNQPLSRHVALRSQSQSLSPQLSGLQPDNRWKLPNSNIPQVQHVTHSPPQRTQHPPESVPGWKRGHPSARGPRRPAPPMPRKSITDPVEIMSREVVAILNKITPQSFVKLTNQLSDIQILNTAMLEKLVRLVFDKAVSEPNFANLYAEMCAILDSSNNYTNFCHVVLNRDTNQYLWIRDLEYSNILTGPYPSVLDCVEAFFSSGSPPSQLINHAVSVAELIISNGNLISVFKATDREEYFGTVLPLSEINPASMSETLFPSKDAATKSLLKKFGFNKMLVSICQTEYLDSIENRGFYGSPAQRRSRLDSLNLSEDERNIELNEIEELEGTVKRRMMGNIRFIGELFKKGIIRATTMHECINELLFAKAIDEQELELVCKLLRTVGEKLEQSASDDQIRAFDNYFTKLLDLSKEKRFNARIRFSIEEIINLRQNSWQERRVTDGPALIEEIRSKIASEEQLKRQQNQSMLRQGQGRGRGHTGRAGPPEPPRPSPRTVLANPNQQLQRRPSIPQSGSETRPRSNSSDSPASTKAVPEVQEREQLSEEAIKRRVNSIIEEYLNLKDPSEASECLVELPESACGHFVNILIGKYLDCGKSDIQRDLMALVRVVMPHLVGARDFVEESLSNCEPLIFLVDSIVDIKQAPELLGTVVAELLSGQACRRQIIDDALTQIRNQNKLDEFGTPDDEVVVIHNRFLSVLASS